MAFDINKGIIKQLHNFTMYDKQIEYHWNRKTFTSVSAFLQVMSQLTF